MSLTIASTESGSTVTLQLAGSLLSSLEAAELRETVSSLMNERKLRIVLDCTDLSFINSMGLGTVVASLTSLRNRGGDLCLACPNSKVTSSLMISQLIRVLRTYDTVDQAIASFGGPSA